MLAGGDEFGGADIGRQHRFLDQLVRLGARARHDLLDAAALVADDLRFGGLEVHRAPLRALLEQGAVGLVQVQQVRHDLRPLVRLGAAGIGQHGRHLGVRQPRMRVDHRGVELVGIDAAVAVHDHVADHRQAVLPGVQRTQAVGQLLGQHGDHAAREVHRGGALVGVVVDRLARLHVVADVGNGNQQPPALQRRLAAAALERLTVHGVVEVARVLAVDRDQRHVGEVDAVLAVDGADAVGQRRRRGQRLGGELVRHLVLAHRDLDLHAGVVDFAQHLGDTAHRLRMQRRRLGEFHRDHLPHRGAGGGILGDQDVLAVAAVLRRHQPLPAFVQQAADDRRLAALQDVDHAAFGAALAVEAQQAHAHAVAVQHAAHFLWRQVDGGVAVVGDDEAVAVAVALDTAVDFTRQSGTGSCRAWCSDFFDDMILGSQSGPGGGIGRRTSFRY